MLKFNNYPPTEAGDVELAEEAKDSIRSRGIVPPQDRQTEYYTNYQALHSYGLAVGITIMNAVNHDIQIAREVLGPVKDEVVSMVGEEYSFGFSTGANTALHIRALHDFEAKSKGPEL